MKLKNISTLLCRLFFTFHVYQVGLTKSAPCFWNEFASILERSMSFFRSGFGTFLKISHASASECPLRNDSLKPFDHQVAGHKFSFSGEDAKIGMMKQSEEYYLLKPVIHPVYGPREINFYELMRTTRDPELEELKEYIPNYDGTLTVTLLDKNIKFIRIEDITRHFKLPCVMDLKIGQKTWEPDASISKIVEQTFISPVMKTIWSFSINGLRYYDIEKRVSVIHDKEYYSKRIFFHEVVGEVYNFVNGESGIQYGLVDSILAQLGRIRSWFQRQKQFLFIGSSILLVYDAERVRNKTRGVDEFVQYNATEIRIRMIDFAHTIPNTKNEVDSNYLHSLENLIYIFENLTMLHVNAYRNGMITRIIRGFSLNETFRYLKQVFRIWK